MFRRISSALSRSSRSNDKQASPEVRTGAKILVVDDDPILRDLLKLLLEKRGYRVVTAVNGLEGLKATRAEEPDAVILDGSMPEMDGFETLKQIRRARRTAHIPVIMLTMRTQEGDVLTGYRQGAQEYLTKPIMVEEVVSTLGRLLSRAG